MEAYTDGLLSQFVRFRIYRRDMSVQREAVTPCDLVEPAAVKVAELRVESASDPGLIICMTRRPSIVLGVGQRPRLGRSKHCSGLKKFQRVCL